MIRSFSDKRTAEIFANRVPKGFPTDSLATARRKLAVLDAAEMLNELRAPLCNIAAKTLNACAAACNNTLRKCLGYKTLAEIFNSHILHFKLEPTCQLALA